MTLAQSWTSPAIPPDPLGEATVSAALAVDRLAVQLLAACGPFDPAPERQAQVRQALDAWPALMRVMGDLAAVAGVGLAGPPLIVVDAHSFRPADIERFREVMRTPGPVLLVSKEAAARFAEASEILAANDQEAGRAAA